MSLTIGIALFTAAAVAGAMVARLIWQDAASGRARFGAGAGSRALRRLAPPNDADRIDLRMVDEAALEAAARRASVGAGGAVKRMLDIALSLGLIIALAPVLALIALAIRIDSPGPVLYRQRRIGWRGRAFSVVKFRSMHVDAEKNGPQYACAGDARATRVGRLLRRLHLDETPQVINVLRGEMSFVGPRPERPEFAARLERAIPHYAARHLVRPGITGWAQVRYEYAASVEGAREKLRYDLYYIGRYSPWLDLRIMALTAWVVLFGLARRQG